MTFISFFYKDQEIGRVRTDKIVGFYITSHIEISGPTTHPQSKQIFQVEAYTEVGDIFGEEEETGSVFIVSLPCTERKDAAKKMDELVNQISRAHSR